MWKSAFLQKSLNFTRIAYDIENQANYSKPTITT